MANRGKKKEEDNGSGKRIRKMLMKSVFFFQAEDGIRDLVRSRGHGDVYKRQTLLQSEAQPAASRSFIDPLLQGDPVTSNKKVVPKEAMPINCFPSFPPVSGVCDDSVQESAGGEQKILSEEVPVAEAVAAIASDTKKKSHWLWKHQWLQQSAQSQPPLPPVPRHSSAQVVPECPLFHSTLRSQRRAAQTWSCKFSWSQRC